MYDHDRVICNRLFIGKREEEIKKKREIEGKKTRKVNMRG